MSDAPDDAPVGRRARDALQDHLRVRGADPVEHAHAVAGGQPQHARELAKLCKTLRANVNLIRYTEVSGLPYRRPGAEDVVTFQNILRHNGVNAHVRKSRGRDIDAACGQLRRKQEQEQGRGREPLVTLG